ncbi:CotH kinase family protein [Ruminococcus sp.]|uniref:CotH kinase family protein n=1 Tax=Ruminococcus sp. TaxID=41978 RepID=UPI0025ED8756|nr:CotH kinase family protein [Ruminococcus sp.]MCR4640128.1 CotH kinase family protein [Ruminococcus sp.]
MSAHKNIDRICIIITAITLVIAFIFCNDQALGIKTTAHAIGYEDRLFDRSKVHTIDIVMNDWEGFIEGCESEEYSACNLVIDGEAVKNVGIRAKGNTSLSSVKNMDSSRYSFKIEFDQYENGKTYHGLDKLCLNNIIQDNTYMKDYLAYTLMNDFGVDAPLCSYAYITVNGEDWGLYLAVEAIEESFLERNYGSNYGDLYKPDAMGFGGGRGNGKDFSMGNFMNKESEEDTESSEKSNDNNKQFTSPDFGGGMPDFGSEMPEFGGDMTDFDPENMPDDFGDFDPSKMFGENGEKPDFGGGQMPDMNGKGGFGGGFGMGSDDVKLKYTDDDIDSYSNIFNNAKTAVDKADKKRLIRSLKALSEQSDLENTVDIEEVIRYFVVHDFLVNGDSYTGQMIHNYYLYEKNGQFSMIPWDYNLAYGSFMGGNASSSVNSPIDTPVSNGMSDRPMIAWIFDNEEYTEQYHQLFSDFLDSVDFEKLVADTAELIDKYVEKDPTKFCTYDEFKTGVEAISKFCTLRAESVSGQLDGTIPSTTEGQKEDSSALVDTDGLNTSDMGSMGGGKGGFGGGQKGGFDRNNSSKKADTSDTSKKTDNSEIVQTSNTSSFSVKMLSNIQPLANEDSSSSSGKPQRGNGEKPDFGGQPPQGFGGDMPDDLDPSNMPDFGSQPPQGFDGEMPDDFDPNNMPDGAPSFGDTEKTSDENANSSETEKVTEAEASSENTEKPAPNADENSSSAPQNENKSRGGERPDMGGFSPMDDSPQQDNTTAYILLGVSMFVLLFGLGFALKFRR